MIVSETPLTSGQRTYAVTFPAPQAITPTVVAPIVLNNSGDAVVLLINAYASNITNTGFDLTLDSEPNSNNYVCSYMAGSAWDFFQSIKFFGQFFTNLSRRTSAPSANDRLLLLSMSPLPHSEQITWETMCSVLSLYQATPPTSATDAGRPGTFSYDGSYLYLRGTSTWSRLPLIPDANWAASYATKQLRSARYALVEGEQIQTFNYSVAFAAQGSDPSAVPDVRVGIMNLSEDASKSVLFATVIASSLTGFSFALNAPPDSDNYTAVVDAALAF
jgi:hypothetical protein